MFCGNERRARFVSSAGFDGIDSVDLQKNIPILRFGVSGENDRMKTTLTKSVVAFLLLFPAAALMCSQETSGAKTGSEEKILAVVLGKKVTAAEKDRLNGLIFSSLLERFEKEHGIALTDEDLDAFVAGSERTQRRLAIEREAERLKLIEALKSSSLSEKERAAKEEHLKNLEIICKANPGRTYQTPEAEERERRGTRSVGRMFVRNWKINQALHAKYGGRVIFQQAGPEPLDAYRKFFEEQEKAGAFQIHDEAAAKSFWNYFVNESMPIFISEEEGGKMMETPWWLMDKAADQAACPKRDPAIAANRLGACCNSG